MRHIVLSNHIAEQLHEKEAQREKQYAVAFKEYKNAAFIRQQRIDDNKKALSTAWKQRKLGRMAKHVFKMFSAMISNKPHEPVKEGPGDEDSIWKSGQIGEEQVQDYLKEHLDENWVLLSGYKNRKGEIDIILVGYDGIFAIEIKYVNGNIYCGGDKWWKDKYDKYGNLVEWDIPIKDKKGRSPSQQLNEPVDILQTFLHRLSSCQIFRMVVFAHESSKLRDINNLTINEVVILKEWNLKNTFEKNKFKLTLTEIEKTVEKIKASHREFNVVRNYKTSGGAVFEPDNLHQE